MGKEFSVNAPEALDRNCEDARCLHVLFPRGVCHVTDSRSPTVVVLYFFVGKTLNRVK